MSRRDLVVKGSTLPLAVVEAVVDDILGDADAVASGVVVVPSIYAIVVAFRGRAEDVIRRRAVFGDALREFGGTELAEVIVYGEQEHVVLTIARAPTSIVRRAYSIASLATPEGVGRAN